MNLNQLYYFQTLANCEHYTQASKELYISQPSLTYAIKELEKELGVSLFYKSGRNIKLTHNGQVFLDYVRQSLDILDTGIALIKNQDQENNQTLNISVIPTIVNNYLAPIIKELNVMWPYIQINFRSEKTLNILQGVKDGQYDFGICSKLGNDNLKYLPILYEELVLITAKDHPLSKKSNISFSDIIKYPLITYQKEISIYSAVMKLFDDKNMTPQVLYELDDETSIASMVSQGFGVAIVANNELLKPFHNIDIFHLDINSHPRIIYLVYNPNNIDNTVSSQVIDYIISHNINL
ncbi:MAG: LysR family transcriptional regulator [Coprobacillus sp.]